MGGRDLVLGIGTLRGLSVSDAEGRPWVALGGVADLVDAVATLVAFGHLPRRARWAYLAIALGAAVTCTRAAIALDSSTDRRRCRPEPAPESGSAGPAPDVRSSLV